MDVTDLELRDGAHDGISPAFALIRLFELSAGKRFRRNVPLMTVPEMVDWLQQPDQDTEEEPHGYNESARRLARDFLSLLLEEPSLGRVTDMSAIALALQAKYPEHFDGARGVTLFQFGWAVNAARRCVEMPALPNPAVVGKSYVAATAKSLVESDD